MIRFLIAVWFLSVSTISFAQNSQLLLNKFCRTWISFERIEYFPMEHSAKGFLINKQDQDSIIMMKNGEFHRYNNGIKYLGKWKFNSDSTSFITETSKSFVSISVRPDLKEEFYIQSLTESFLMVSFNAGKEGETIQIKYKSVNLPTDK